MVPHGPNSSLFQLRRVCIHPSFSICTRSGAVYPAAQCWLLVARYWYKIHYDLELVPVMCCGYGCPAPPYLGRPGDQSFAVEVKSSQVCTCVCKYVSVFVRYHNTIRSYTYHFTSIITASYVHTFKDMVGWFVVSSVVNLVGDNMLWLCYILMRQ